MATASKTLTTSYASLGAGPMLITLEAGESALLHIASSAPADTDPGHTLYKGTNTFADRSWFNYVGTDTVYAKKDDSPGNQNSVILSYTA